MIPRLFLACLFPMAMVLAFPALALDREEILAAARDLGRQGKEAEALPLLNRVLDGNPQDWEARILRARLLSWSGQLETAETETEALLRELPNNPEVAALAGSIAWYGGHQEKARAYYERALALDPDQTEAREGLKRVQAAAPKRWRFDTGYENSSYPSSSGRKDWQEAMLRIGYAWDSQTRIHIQGNNAHRFGKVDRMMEIGIDHEFLPWLRGYANAAGTPAADFLPEYKLMAGASARLRKSEGIVADTWGTFDLKQASYTSGETRFAAPGVQQYLFGGRAWATGRFLLMEDERGKHPTGWEARLDWQALDRLRLFFGMADAPETDDNRSLPTTSRFLGAVFGVSDDIDLTLSASRIAQDGLPRRRTFGAALSAKF
jgi:YaiO family outer membrane protein